MKTLNELLLDAGVNRYGDTVAVVAALTEAEGLCRERIDAVLTNVESGTDGSRLKSLLFVTSRFLGELEFASGRQTLDFVEKASLLNYRIARWKHEQPSDVEGLARTLLIAEVTLFHRSGGQIMTTLKFVGYAWADREAWLRQVVAALPLDLVLTR